MNILFLSDNYPPEMNANARIVSETSSYWADKNLVTILTSQPNFPQGKIFKNYKNKWVTFEKNKNLNIIRIKTYMTANSGFIKRSIDFLSFGLHSFFRGCFEKNNDIIVGISPQFFCALSACLIALVRRKPFIFILCDLWPDAIMSTGHLKKGFLFKVLKKLEFFMYQRAALIATLSPFYNKHLIKQGISESKIYTFISGVDTCFYPREKNKALIEKYNLHHKFVIACIGTMGISHNHQDILEVASLLKQKSNQSIHFLMIGDGIQKEKLAADIKNKKLDNVIIDGPFPSSDIPEYWSISDMALVPLANNKTNKTVIPSKMLEAMAMGKPIILYAPLGEARKFLKESKAGIFCEAGHQEKLLNILLNIEKDSSEMSTLSNNAIHFAAQYTREQQSKSLLNKFQEIINNLSQPI